MKGIVVCFFGTTHLDTFKKCIKPIYDEVIRVYGSKMPVIMAYTSRIIVKKLRSLGIMNVMTEVEALSKLTKEGVRNPIVFSLHLLHGNEYEKIISLKKNYPNLKVTKPLFDSFNSIDVFTKTLKLDKDKNYVLMGHGSCHESDEVYDYLADFFNRNGKSNVYVATVEGKRSLDVIMPDLMKIKDKSLTLKPLMLVAGDHAKNDMAGDDKNSWKEILKSKGFNIRCDISGLGESKEIRELFYFKLKEVID